VLRPRSPPPLDGGTGGDVSPSRQATLARYGWGTVWDFFLSLVVPDVLVVQHFFANSYHPKWDKQVPSMKLPRWLTVPLPLAIAEAPTVLSPSNIGPLFINNFTGLQNTFLQIGTTGNILNITSNYSKYGISEDPNETHILMFQVKGAGIYYSANYNTSGNTLHLFGESTSKNYLKLQPLLNTSYNPLIVQGNTTINSNLNILENIYAKNLPNVSEFNVIISQSVLLNSSTFYKHDLDLRLYTTFINPVPFILQRKFKFTCCLLSGELDLGLYNLYYDIDYNSVNYPSTGPQASHAQYNGINVLAYGFPYSNQ
jgi:hypothetical protein